MNSKSPDMSLCAFLCSELGGTEKTFPPNLPVKLIIRSRENPENMLEESLDECEKMSIEFPQAVSFGVVLEYVRRFYVLAGYKIRMSHLQDDAFSLMANFDGSDLIVSGFVISKKIIGIVSTI